MPQPKVITLALSSSSATAAICASQAPTSSVNLTLNGALANAAGTLATLDTAGNFRQVSISSSGNDSVNTFIITGKLMTNGQSVTETLTGPNSNTVYSVNMWLTVTSVNISGAAVGTIQVGISAVGASIPYVTDWYISPFDVSMTFYPGTSDNCSVQYSMDTPFSGTTVPVWQLHPNMQNMTAINTDNFNKPVKQIRLLRNSATGTDTLAIVQAGLRG